MSRRTAQRPVYRGCVVRSWTNCGTGFLLVMEDGTRNYVSRSAAGSVA